MKKQIVGCMVLALLMTGCSSGKSDVSEQTEAAANVSTEVAVTESSVETAESDSVSDKPCGVYSRIEKRENYEGFEHHEREFIYSFNEDGTGMARCDVDFPIKWDDKNIYWGGQFDDEPVEYKLEGDILKVNGDGEYTKKPGDDLVLNGDLSKFAGVYMTTDESNSANGHGKTLGDLHFSWGGELSGSEYFPQTWPSKVTKNEDGSYLCEYDDYDFEYIIYPKGLLDEKEAGNPELKDKVYIRAIIKKDGDVKEEVYYRYAAFKAVSISGTWQMASITPMEDGSMEPEYYVQFTDSEINYGHMKDGEFELDHSDKISNIKEVLEGVYKVQAESEKGVKYTYQTSESDKDTLEYYETWDEADFSNTYSAGASLSRTK